MTTQTMVPLHALLFLTACVFGNALAVAQPAPEGPGAPARASTPASTSEAVRSDPPRPAETKGATPAAAQPESATAQPESAAASLVMVSFDETGRMVDPGAFTQVVDQFGAAPTDVYIMSHGWNNSPAEALQSYTKMVGLVKAAADGDHTRPSDYRPMLLGVRWPSKAWINENPNESVVAPASVLESTESGPASVTIDPRIVAALYENLPRSKATESEYSRDILRLQELLVKPNPGPQDFQELLTTFRRYAIDADFPEDANIFNSDAGVHTAMEQRVSGGRLEAASMRFSPLDLARIFTYWQMKGRAGLVGRLGVRSMIAALQTRYPAARFHLFGHSFGSKVVLAAVAERDLGLPRPVNTLVLIQGAVSLEAMAKQVTDSNQPGGYRAALDPSRVKNRIIVTFSRLDSALNDFYPLASRVAGQTGELQPQAIEAVTPSKYSALGAFGAYGADSQLLSMNLAGQAYVFSNKVVSVDGGASAAFIGGHSAIFNANVAWLLWSAVKESF